jgi:hypothetical protein
MDIAPHIRKDMTQWHPINQGLPTDPCAVISNSFCGEERKRKDLVVWEEQVFMQRSAIEREKSELR